MSWTGEGERSLQNLVYWTRMKLPEVVEQQSKSTKALQEKVAEYTMVGFSRKGFGGLVIREMDVHAPSL